MSEKISATTARAIAVASAGIGTLGRGGPEASLAALRRLGSVQIDTISVVERAHDHVLWSRNAEYRVEHLPILEAAPRRAIEYWSHAAAFLPIEDYRFCLPRMERVRAHGHDWFKAEPEAVAYVRSRIRAEGPLRAQDFSQPMKEKRGWWDWKPAKIALEFLFHAGELISITRRGFQKVYDLAERALPLTLDLRMPTGQEMAARYVDQAVSSLGVFEARDIAYMRKEGLEWIGSELASRVEDGRLIEIDVAGLPGRAVAAFGRRHYASPDALCRSGRERGAEVGRAAVLSPFDPLIIDRKRTARLFGRDYQLECYLPEAKRAFGYFALPLLHRFPDGDVDIIGLVDAKAERGTRILLARRLSLDLPAADIVRAGGCAAIAGAIATALMEFASFNGACKIELQRIECANGRMERSLRAAVARGAFRLSREK